MLMKKFLLFAALAVVTLCSCSDRLVDFTVISTKNMPLGNGQPTTYAKGNTRVEGVDKKSIILGIPMGSPNLKTAIDKAIEKYPGAVGLADGVVKSTYWWALLFGESGYVVEGTPIYDPNAGNGNQQYNYNQPQNSNQQPEQSASVMVFHDVKKGETLSDVAKMYGCTIGDIVKWNKLSSTTISEGAKLKIFIQ